MRFTHLRDDSGYPFATVAHDELNNIGVAICSSHDQFNKKVGRYIASGRLEKGVDRTPMSQREVWYEGELCNVSELVESFTSVMK